MKINWLGNIFSISDSVNLTELEVLLEVVNFDTQYYHAVNCVDSYGQIFHMLVQK